ncbi:MAG: HAD hydrolase family protein [Gammaproteobacteria bacterium]|nr:HAD hydrolase family protein [Gammaproteobacteria bacterium]
MAENKILIEKAARIRLLISDVDGVMTDGSLWFTADLHSECKPFHCHDGVGFKMLEQAGIHVAVLSSRNSSAAIKRMVELNVPKAHILMGQKDKRVAYQKLKDYLHMTDEEIAYIGDDLPDLPIMKQVGFSIAVANAVPFVSQVADWQTKRLGGQGAVREACEFLLRAQNKLDSIQNIYLL